uniref:26S proteasome regulatory subunit 6A homolog n=1 Tax=Tanacetum cinerariifolium TaxID=118510 RepID=A0A6L2KZ28_TANCI|nr:26S proteasome regulatory subunit 6A homolog [Tanacetum cinerariifolium]
MESVEKSRVKSQQKVKPEKIEAKRNQKVKENKAEGLKLPFCKEALEGVSAKGFHLQIYLWERMTIFKTCLVQPVLRYMLRNPCHVRWFPSEYVLGALNGRSGTLVGQGSVVIVTADVDYLPRTSTDPLMVSGSGLWQVRVRLVVSGPWPINFGIELSLDLLCFEWCQRIPPEGFTMYVNFEDFARSIDDFNGAHMKVVCVEAAMVALRRDATQIGHLNTIIAVKKRVSEPHFAVINGGLRVLSAVINGVLCAAFLLSQTGHLARYFV